MPTINPVSTVPQQNVQQVTSRIKGTTQRGVGGALLRFADAATKEQMTQEAERSFLEGQQQIAQGKSLQEVKDNQSGYTKFFGESATVRGARALDTEVALDNMYRAELESIPQAAEMNPEGYALKQQESLKQITSGITDEKQRAALTVAFAKKAGELASIQTKAHAQYVDVTMRKSYHRAVLSKADTMQQSIGTQAEASAAQELIQAISQPKGMTSDAYLSEITDAVKASLEGGNGSVYNHVFGSPLFDELSADQKIEIHRSRSKYETEQLKEQSIEVGRSIDSIEAYVDTPNSTMDVVLDKLEAHKSQYGISAAKVEGILNKLRTKGVEVNETDNLTELARNRQFSQMLPAQQKEALLRMREEFGDAYPKYWSEIGVIDKTMSSEWTNSFTNMTMEDGTIDPRFAETFQSFMQFNKLDPVRAMAHLKSDEVKIRTQAILDRVAVDGDIEKAIRSQNLVEQNTANGKFTTEQRTELTEAVKDVMTDGVFTEYSDFNSGYINATIQRKAETYLANGRTDVDTAVKLAEKDFATQHDLVKGDYVPNGGVPMAKRLGLRSDQKVDEVLDTFVNKNRTEMFGAHEGDYRTVVNAASNTMTFVPIDKDSQPLAGGMVLSLDAMKSLNELETAKVHERELQAAGLKAQTSEARQIATLRAQWASRGNNLTEDQARRIVTTGKRQQTEVHKNQVGMAVNSIARVASLGANAKKFYDIFEPLPTAPEQMTQLANNAAAVMGLAPPTKVGLGWGMETQKVMGPESAEVGKMLDVFALTESGGGKYRANPTSSARGLFQYMTEELSGGNNAFQTAVTRAERSFDGNEPQWFKEAKKVAFEGTDEQRAEYLVKLDDDKSAALMLMDFKARPETNELLNKAQTGDKEAVRELYYTYHHTNPDESTTRLFEKNLKRIYGE